MCAFTTKPGDKLTVHLDYYNATHQGLLAKGAYALVNTASKVKAFQAHGKVPLQDFLAFYYIYRDKDPRFGTFAARMNSIDQAATHLDGAISLAGTLNTLLGSEDEQKRVGEAMSLAIANTLFGLTAADWARIPISNKFPTFDTQRTLTAITAANIVVQIEAKGTFLDGGPNDTKRIKAHADNIATKKAEIAAIGASYPHPAAVRYGMIIAAHPTKTLKCLLLDPPGDDVQGEPSNLKVAFRLDYAADILSLIAPSAHLVDALKNRAELWRKGTDPERFRPMRTARGTPFFSAGYVENALAQQKVWLPELDVVGHVFEGRSGHLFFLGIQGGVLRTVIDHVPADIVSMAWIAESREVTLMAAPVLLGRSGKGPSREFRMMLHKATSGLVIGQSLDAGADMPLGAGSWIDQ